jgi:hypothetical protein
VSEENEIGGFIAGNITAGGAALAATLASAGSFTLGDGAPHETAYLVPPHEMMTEEECVRHGGHCFEDTGEVLASNPPQYKQRCRHCAKERVAIPREPFEYRDHPH